MTPQSLSLGKARALQQCAAAGGVFTILAADHRDAMRVMIDAAHPQDVLAQTLTDIKLDIVQSLGDLPSAVLLDPSYSAAQAIAGGALTGRTGLLVALEELGYLGDPYSRETTSLSGWGVEKARRLGATGVKVCCSTILTQASRRKNRNSIPRRSSRIADAMSCPSSSSPFPIR
jgi:tagatose 1,6-diphosphate aldolase